MVRLFLYLAVANAGVAVGIGGEHTAQCGDAHLVLEGAVLGHGAMQVPLDLLCSQGAATHGLLHQVAVVTWVSSHLILSSCRDHAWETASDCCL